MRAVVALLLAALMLAGCGDETSSGGAADHEPRGTIDFELVGLVTETAVGGMVSAGAVALADTGATKEFATQFDDDRMETRLVQLLGESKVPHDKAAYAAVVSVGCEAPAEVTVTSTDTGILIEPTRAPVKQVECFAPATTVAVVLVDESVVG